MRKLLLVLLFIIPVVSFCQNEYKITTESALRQEVSGSDAVVTAFVTITNIGNPDNWYENFSGFVLQSKNTREVYKLIDARNILEDEVMPNGVISASLSFLVPKSADSIMLKYPERYGGKETFLFRSYYLSKNDNESETYVGENGIVLSTGHKPENKGGDNNSSNPENNNGSNKPSKVGKDVSPLPAYFNLLTGGIGFMKSSSGNKNQFFWQALISVKPFLYTFKKQKLALLLDIEGGITTIQYMGNDNSDNFLSFFGIDKDIWVAKHDHGKIIPINNWSVYVGLGMAYNKNPNLVPYISSKLGWNSVSDGLVRIYSKVNGPSNTLSYSELLRGPGFKLEVGVYINNWVCLSYNFYSYKATSGNSALNSSYLGHFLNLALGSYVL